MPQGAGHELEDEPLKQEIALLGELMAAAAEATGHLAESKIDEALNGDPAPRADTADASPEVPAAAQR